MMEVGAKFVATKDTKDNNYPPGTKGFVSYVQGRDLDFPNTLIFHAIVVRRGKNGMKRTDTTMLSAPIINMAEEGYKVLEGYLEPPNSRPGFIRIELAPSKDLIKCSSLDFIGWASANAMFYSKLLSQSPNPVKHPFNTGILNKILESLSPDAEFGEQTREDVISILKMMSAEFSFGVRRYMQSVTTAKIKALEEIVKFLRSNKKLNQLPLDFSGWSSILGGTKFETQMDMNSIAKGYKINPF